MISPDGKHARRALHDPAKRLRLLLITVLLLVLIKAWSTGRLFTLPPARDESGLFAQDVIAQTLPAEQAPAAPSGAGAAPDAALRPREMLQDDFAWRYELVAALQKRDEELRIREYELKKNEERIEALARDLDERIGVLSGLEKKIFDMVEQKRVVENEQMQKLAKVFEETPPEQAGPLISRLDVDIAAQLILRMNNRKAGRMWGFVEPEQAVRISGELARLNPAFRMVPDDQ